MRHQMLEELPYMDTASRAAILPAWRAYCARYAHAFTADIACLDCFCVATGNVAALRARPFDDWTTVRRTCETDVDPCFLLSMNSYHRDTLYLSVTTMAYHAERDEARIGRFTEVQCQLMEDVRRGMRRNMNSNLLLGQTGWRGFAKQPAVQRAPPDRIYRMVEGYIRALERSIRPRMNGYYLDLEPPARPPAPTAYRARCMEARRLDALGRMTLVYDTRRLPPEWMLPVFAVAFRLPERRWLAARRLLQKRKA